MPLALERLGDVQQVVEGDRHLEAVVAQDLLVVPEPGQESLIRDAVDDVAG